jgi:general stress protein YciG
MSTPEKKSPRGTAAMSPQTRQEVARKGGLAVSKNRQHMAEIGRRGGQSVSKNREHMAEIGRKGGAASRRRPAVEHPQHPGAPSAASTPEISPLSEHPLSLPRPPEFESP